MSRAWGLFNVQPNIEENFNIDVHVIIRASYIIRLNLATSVVWNNEVGNKCFL